MLFDIHDLNNAQSKMTKWLSTDELSRGVFVKLLYVAFVSHYKTIILKNNQMELLNLVRASQI